MAKEKKKEKQKQGVNTTKVVKKGNRFFLNLGIILFVLSTITAVGAYFVFVTVTAVPDLPPVELDTWWGPKLDKPQDTYIRPYRILFTDALQETISHKFDSYRSTIKRKSLNESWTYGVNSEGFAQIVSHWLFKYNYKERQRFLNKYEHYKTNVQGLDIHYVHVKPKVERNVKVIPILLLHGWPSTFRDFYDVIPELTTLNKQYNFAFEVIAPSIPGFAYSQAPVKPGFGPVQAAVVMRNLMKRLGFTYYYVHGSDFGHAIGTHMATYFPDEVLGFHSSSPVNFSKWATLAWVLGAIWPKMAADGLEDRMYPLKEKVEFYLEEFGYMHLQATKPDTIGITLQDSPAGLAAYLLDRYVVFTDPNNKFTEYGGFNWPAASGPISVEAILDNVVIYLATGCITTSMRFYKESVQSNELEKTLALIPTPVPTWGLRLRHELMQQPDYVLRWKYTNLLGTTTLNDGGHFAALEKPKELAADIFKAVEEFIKFYKTKTK